MNIPEILNSRTNITISVSVNDLKEWHKTVIEDTKEKLENLILSEKAERYLSAKQVSEMLNVDLSTLWRWEQKEYLIPAKVGGKRRYKLSDVKSLLERK